MIVKVTYKQKYMGGILTDSYEREISDYDEIGLIHKALYSDPHVCFVDVEILEEVDEMYDSKLEEQDMVNNPSHYNQGLIETINIIESSMTPEMFKGYLLGNVLKYMLRAPYKGNQEQDHEKAKWYFDKLRSVSNENK